MDVTIPKQNPAVAAALLSRATRAKMEERANTAVMLYQAQVAKRSGRLAASARGHVSRGGQGRRHNDRWIAELIVGGIGAQGSVDYAAPHEFGRQHHIEGPALPSADGQPKTGGHHAAHDLNMVLSQLGSY